jgi:ankyrin repeat protein
MSLRGLFCSHAWDGCRCTKCGKARNENHKWAEHACSVCGKTITAEEAVGPLAAMLRAGDVPESLKKAIAYGLNTKDEQGILPLSKAAMDGDLGVVMALLAAGTHPLGWAASCGHAEIVRILLEAGADLEARNLSGCGTALAAAAIKGQVDAAKTLLAAGADVNAKGPFRNTPLMQAALGASTAGSPEMERAILEVVKVLVAAGADVEAKDNEGRSASDLCPHDGFTKLLQSNLAGTTARE